FAGLTALFVVAPGNEMRLGLQCFGLIFAATFLWASSHVSRLRSENRFFESQLVHFKNTILELQDHREKNRQIMEGSLDALVTLDQDEEITGWNQRSHKIFGWRREDVLGRGFVETLIPKRYRELFRQGVERCLVPGDGLKPARKAEIKVLHREGREFPVEINAVNFRMQGEVQLALFLRDISDRWKAEENMRVHLAEIERLNESLSKQKNEMDVFQNVVTNEIANFCAALQSSVEVMLHYLEEAPTPAQEELLFRCQRQIFEMNRLTENIHLLHQLRQNGIVPIHDSIRLQRALAKSVDTVRSMHFDRDFEVTIDCPESIVISRVPYIDVLFLSVIDEAVRGGMGEDGSIIRIRGSEDDGRINVSLKRTSS
ncbi:MAG: PAS domain S-box protein, partial [Spirochaetia bacterium]|nr:PAS domain S-box protein [Spirochaetia bacterium]